MKTLIVDDQKEIREGLRLMLEKFCPQVTSIHEADGVVAGIRAIHEIQPDLLFTDVEMQDGTGMDMLNKVQDINFQVVFITAYNKYAVDAFRFSAIDFLLKPVEPDLLAEAVKRASFRAKQNELMSQLSVLNNRMRNSDEEKKIVLKDQKAIYVIKVSDIAYLQAEGVYTHFFIGNGEKVMVSKNIKEYEELLEGFGFMRVHNTYLVNLNRIVRFDKTDGGSLVLDGGQTVPVSSRKKDALLEYLKSV